MTNEGSANMQSKTTINNESTIATMDPVRKLLRNTRCMDLLKGQAVIEIDAEDSVAKGCQTLISHGISSAPVYSSDKQEYVGMLDYRDIVDYVLTVFHKKQLQPISEDEVIGIHDIVHQATMGRTVPTEAIVVMSHSSLEAAVEIFSSNLGIHRINVLEIFGEGVAKTIKDAGLANSTVLDAMERMSEYGISSVPVIDSNNHLVGNISMADIRFVFQHNRFNRLWLSCINFISLALSQKGLENDGRDSYPVFDIPHSTTICTAMQKLLATKTHRIWVVAEDGQLEGVISLTDIIRYLCKSPPKRSLPSSSQ